MASLSGVGRHLKFLAAALAVLLLSSAALAQTRRAVIVGIDKYSLPEAAGEAAAPAPAPAQTTVSSHAAKRNFREGWVDLDGAVNDALAMAQLLQSRYGFQKENVHYLLGPKPDSTTPLPPHEAPTRDNILKAIETYLIQEAKPGDVVVFYYAGHGSQVYNSLSNKFTKLDESIVPADVNAGALDIRDKELSRIFNRVLGGLNGEPDRHVIFTAIFDSCHSGSIARGFQVHPGKLRYMLPDMRDAHDKPDDAKPPEDRGALIISSALDTQPAAEATDENNTSHGAFTLSLLRALTTLPVDAPAKDVFFSARSILKSLPQGQDPVLAGSQERQRQPLFGGQAGGVTGKISVRVTDVDEDGNVTVEGGLALGLAPKCELVPAGTSKTRGAETGPHLRLTSEVGLTSSKAKVVGGKPEDIKVGQSFVLDRWVASSGAMLKVWVPPSQLSDAELRAAAAEFLKLGERVQWLDDPTAASPTHILAWNGTEWTLSTNGAPAGVGRNPTAQQIAQKLGPADPKQPVKLFLSLPPTAELAAALKQALTERKAVEMAARPQDATYVLMGHIANDAGHALEYAWVLPNTLKDEKSVAPPPNQRKQADQGEPTPPVLPARTDWVATSQNTDQVQAAAGELQEYTLRIERIQGWLQLPSPPDEGGFPYHLVLRNVGKAVGRKCPGEEASGKEVADGSSVQEGECYQMYLAPTDSKRIVAAVDKRWVYIFTIDSHGDSKLFYPDLSHGNVDNRIPQAVAGEEDKPIADMPVGPRIRIVPPPGIDTYVMLTTEEQVPDPSVFEAKGVRTRAFRSPPKNALDSLLRRVGDNTRGTAGEETPNNWSVQRISIKSEEKEQGK